MNRSSLFAFAAAALALAGCGGEGAERAEDSAAPANAAAGAEPAAAADSADEQGPALVYTLAGDGLEPGLSFGLAQAEAVAAATAAFGAPTGEEHNDECGEGPMDFVNFRDLSLGFQDGRLAGWSLDGPMPSLRTAAGLAIGAPRSALGDAAIDRESTLGPEFSVDGVGGLFDDRERAVVALWAGRVCQFR